MLKFKTFKDLEICFVLDNKTTWEFNRETRRSFERVAGKILKNATLTFIVCLLIAGVISLGGTIIQNTLFPLAIPCVDTGKIDVLGRNVLALTRKVGYYVCLIMCTKDIISSVTSGSYKDILGIVARYAAAFAGFYALPSIFDYIAATLG